MEIRHLRYFVAVVEAGGFSAASERLHIAQPALSVQVRALEEELGIQLLVRTSRRMELTPSGAVFFESAREILRLVASAVQQAREVSAGQAGTVSLGFIASASSDLVPLVVSHLRTAAPAIHLRLLEMTTTAQISALERGDIDCAILRGPIGTTSFETETLRADQVVALLPRSHRLSNKKSLRLVELRGDDFIFFPRDVAPGLYDQLQTECRESGFEPLISHEASDYRTILDLVAVGAGVSIQPSGRVGAIARGVAGVKLIGSQTMSMLILASRPTRDDTAISTVREAVRSAVRVLSNHRTHPLHIDSDLL